ncbi:kinase-like protein, partial [Phellopilus nigrolimitatus]
LAGFTHLNLTGRVSYDNQKAEAHGEFCDVFVGDYTPQTSRKFKVAVRRLRVHVHKDRDFEKISLRLLAKEIKVWSELKHPNILPLWGYVLEGAYPCLVSERMDNGTVSSYIKSQPNCDVLRIIYIYIYSQILGIANGIHYLHDKDIFHSDIKFENVLVNRFGTPLICDFGISRTLSATQSLGSTSGVKESVRWMAPEILDITSSGQTDYHTKSSDVWAFGMTVYEILAKQSPYSHLKSDVHVMFAIIHGELPSLSAQNLDSLSLRHRRFYSLCGTKLCWNKDPELR